MTRGRNIYRAGDFYDVVIWPTGDSVSARGDIWRGANLLRDTGSFAVADAGGFVGFGRTTLAHPMKESKRKFASLAVLSKYVTVV